ncbi:MAG: AmmeMemoRadiSam system protein B [bacterium]|nr:AmmeMemoRadiSam system protein B [bacterium]
MSPSPSSKTAEPGPASQVAATRPSLLNIDRLESDQRELIVQTAAKLVANAVFGKGSREPLEALGGLANSVVMGAFVTLKRGEILRGCCGALGRPMSLAEALTSSAAKTATEDQRMAAISPNELPYLTIDVTLLGPFNRIAAQGAERQKAIKIGRHGLMIQRNGRSGLLLPSVATERGWNSLQFLHAVCNKAGLPIGSWESPDATLFTFDGRAMGGSLSELLPADLPMAKPVPLTEEQLAGYAQVAGENVAAMVRGGTPSYVIPGLPDVNANALVLSMRWEPEEEGGQVQHGNLLQVSFRPGIALQSTLFQMCQQAASMFLRQRFQGQMQIGLTVGFDPAMHGHGMRADLSGLESSGRALLISDARHCGLAFDPEQTYEQLREKLRGVLPISARDAAVHSMQIVSTLPKLLSVSAPIAMPASGGRPPAVAGKFYPAQDAARRAMIGTLFKDDEPEKTNPLAIMVPHAGIKYSGRIAAQVWRSLEAPAARSMVIISPKHTPNGVNWSVCPFDDWQLSSTTTVAGDPELARQIADAVTPLQLDAAAHQQEHGIEVQLPILERLDPACKVVGIALNGGSWDDIQAAAKEFAEFLSGLPELPLLVISSDMNHYAPDSENRRRDRLALDAMASGDPQKLLDTCREHEISMCGQVPAAFVMETLRQLGREFKVVELDYATSADVTGDKSQVVGYAGSLLLPA